MAAAQCFISLVIMPAIAALLFLPNYVFSASTLLPNTDGFYVYDFLRSVGADVDGEYYDAPATVPSPVCPWKGVTCNPDTGMDEQLQQQPGDGADPQLLRITGLSATGLGLRGVIPENTVGKLRGLRHLDLSRNLITGGFPSDFWGLGGSLRSINISFNSFTGTLPNDIGNLGLLEVLDISHNGFSGEIPASFGSLGSLKHVDLSGNAFEGTVPDGLLFLGWYRSLVALDISSNMLEDVIPAGRFGAGQQLEPIRYINVSRNSLRGSLFGLFQLPLEVLDVSDNEFDAADWLNDAFVHSPHLKHLSLAGNHRLLPEFPAGVGELTELVYLNLSSTGLTGRIPVDISKLANLATLDLSRNHLVGTIPHNMPTGNLKQLDLSWNNLTGQVPASLLEKLVADEGASSSFNFSYNHLSFCSASLGSPSETIRSAFIGVQDDCPLAVDPHNLTAEETRKSPKRVRRLVTALSLAALFVLVGLVCVAVGCSKSWSDGSRKWAGKQQQLSYRDGDHDEHHKEMDDTQMNNLSGSFSYHMDSSASWVADVKCPKTVPVVIFEKPLLSLAFADLLLATSHFDRGTLLADGKFGPVYRGFLPGGIQVAVKVLLAPQDGSSCLTDREAEREFERLGRVKHPNLVPLVGYCVPGERIKIAIYEYMENGTLQSLIHDLPLGVVQAMGDDDYCWASDDDDDDGPWDCIRGTTVGIGGAGGGSGGGSGNVTLSYRISHHGGLITWRFRHRIALGVARALAFLHHGCSPQIIHRDVKASSIFLDSIFEARLSDSGLARLSGTEEAIHDDENRAGRSPTGYAPPEAPEIPSSTATVSTITAASDVYAFGVVLFELITSKKPVGDSYPDVKEATTLAHWVRGLVRKNQAFRAIDPKIRDTGSKKQMEEGLRIGYLCTADHPSKRPSMQQIVGLLKDIEPAAADCIAVVDP